MKKFSFKKQTEEVIERIPVKPRVASITVIPRNLGKPEIELRLSRMKSYNEYFRDDPRHQTSRQQVEGWLEASGYDKKLADKVFG